MNSCVNLTEKTEGDTTATENSLLVFFSILTVFLLFEKGVVNLIEIMVLKRSFKIHDVTMD